MTTPAEPELVTAEDLVAFRSGSGIEETRLAGVISAIRGFCEWHVAPVKTETMTVDGNGHDVLLLRTHRIVSVTSVVENGVTLDPSAYEWSAKGMLRKRSGWTDRWRGVVVTLEHGYPVVPDEVKAVVLDATTQVLATEPDAVAEKIGPFEYSGSAGGVQLLPNQLAVLARYKIGWGA
ncbi:hypothetical protein [Rhodococcus tibetensis]|uniref:Head-to-tail adaptor n=1 Tax=Rhodococcus tibetensis TaxID=2965064 RepID=A0ABT1QCB1_9NOCA|nr:hypothetical protein [Rhodococcus sp. FXJ9.536]MCQ4119881.1 hypothetical protein [Rhodococcus sp. FXJ9.536]